MVNRHHVDRVTECFRSNTGCNNVFFSDELVQNLSKDLANQLGYTERENSDDSKQTQDNPLIDNDAIIEEINKLNLETRSYMRDNGSKSKMFGIDEGGSLDSSGKHATFDEIHTVTIRYIGIIYAIKVEYRQSGVHKWFGKKDQRAAEEIFKLDWDEKINKIEVGLTKQNSIGGLVIHTNKKHSDYGTNFTKRHVFECKENEYINAFQAREPFPEDQRDSVQPIDKISNLPSIGFICTLPFEDIYGDIPQAASQPQTPQSAQRSSTPQSAPAGNKPIR